MTRHFVDKHIRIADLADENNRVTDCVFERCHIEGPAVLGSHSGSTIRITGRVAIPSHDMVWPALPLGRVYVGAIGIIDVSFIDCEFDGIGFAGHQAFVDTIIRGFFGDDEDPDDD